MILEWGGGWRLCLMSVGYLCESNDKVIEGYLCDFRAGRGLASL